MVTHVAIALDMREFIIYYDKYFYTELSFYIYSPFFNFIDILNTLMERI